MKLSVSVLLFVSVVNTFRTSSAESYDGGPPKHKGVFHKQQVNKTIPFSEKPGEELIVFDVDGTLWPYLIDTDPAFQDPFVIKGLEGGAALVGNLTVQAFPEVEATLAELTAKGYVLAAVSLTNSTSKTMAMLNALDLTKHFKHMEMAPEPDKLSLITAIHGKLGVDFENMIFLMHKYSRHDIHALLDVGVLTLPVGVKGLHMELAADALYLYSTRKRDENISDDELPTTTESRKQKKLRKQQEKVKRREMRKQNKSDAKTTLKNS